MLRKVVLPLPVPPEMTMFSRARTQAARKSMISGVTDLRAIRSLASSGRDRKPPDRDQSAIQGERPNDGVDAAAVG